MSTDRVVRSVFFVLLIAVALFPSFLLLNDFLRVYSHTDAQLMATFVGAAPEDIFGFGFWPLWLGFAFVEAVLLSSAWFLLARRWLHSVIFLALVFFVAASVLNYVAFIRESSLWSSYVSNAIAG